MASNANTDSTPSSKRPSRGSSIDPTALMQIKSLSLRAKAVVEGFNSGLHRSPLHGFSVEFAQYRPYTQGDDPRNLDWKLLARTDRCYVKQYEDETNRRCYLAIDQSRSMSFGSGEHSKAEYARTLAATLAYFLHLQRDTVGCMRLGTDSDEYLPPRNRTGHLQQIMRLLESESDGRDSDLSAALTELAGYSKRRGLVVLLSDLLTEPDTLFQPLGYLRGRQHEVVVIRVLDPAEVNFQLTESTMLQDLETGQELYIDPSEAKAEYDRRFAVHQQQLIDILHKRNGRLLTVTTDQPLDGVLLELISNTRTLDAQASQKIREKRREKNRGSSSEFSKGAS
ncbi:MAG: DUF58 domain-containing protein [Pirellulaceae bacterium]